MRITQKRNGKMIDFYHGENIIASLHDESTTIQFDRYANSAEIFGIEPPIDYPAEFRAMGLDATTARLIDAMPAPDEGLRP